MRTQSRTMPFTEEQMQQIYNTNLIDFAVRHGFEIEKGDRNTVHVKHSGGLYLFKHGRGISVSRKRVLKATLWTLCRSTWGQATSRARQR